MDKEFYIKNWLKFYKNIEKAFCPYLNSEVWLTYSGFNHLIYKSDRTRRTEYEIKARMQALTILADIIKSSGTVQEMEQKDNGQIFYAFIAILKKRKYKVVVANTKDGRFIFKSVIPRWKTGKRDLHLKSIEIKNSSEV